MGQGMRAGALAVLLIVAGLVAIKPDTRAVAGEARLVMPNGKTYRAYQRPDRGITIETSFDGGANWTYGFDLGGYSLRPGATISMFAISEYAYVAIRNETTGYDYAKGWPSGKCDGGCVGAEPWVPLRNIAADRVP